MNPKILVAYATRAGSTKEVAEVVGEVLTSRGYTVDVQPVKQAADLSGYAAVVIGSAVRFGQWVPEAVKFVEHNQNRLNQIPTALFTVHILNTADDESSRSERDTYLTPVRKLIHPAAEAFFAGVGDLEKVSFIERFIGKMVKSPEGDYRDWAAIRSWAEEIPLPQP